jgi:diacylglycerol kinase family enzyme
MPTSTTMPDPAASVPAPSIGPLSVVMNRNAGHGQDDTLQSEVRGVLEGAGREFTWIDAGPREMSAALREAAARARRNRGTLVAIGGDGTINSAAIAALDAGVPLGLVPRGTFNYFARALGMPLEASEAAQVLLTGRVAPVQAGGINGRPFLVNASLGLYPQLLEDREAFLQRVGRNRALAIVSSLVLAVRGWRQLRVDADSGAPALRTPTLFVCNNRVQLERLGFDEDLLLALEHGQLVGLNARPITTLQMLALILRGALGQLGEADRVERLSFRRMVVRPPGRRSMKVAIDGEVLRLRTPIVIEVLPQPLQVVVPSTPMDAP